MTFTSDGAALDGFSDIQPSAARMIDDVHGLLEHDIQGARRTLLDLQALFQDLPIWDGRSSFVAERPLSVQPEASRDAVGGMAPWRLKRVVAFIQDRLHDGIAVKDLAEAAGLSPSHFCRAFKVSVGEAPHAYVMRMRLERAKVLMAQTDRSLIQIAKDCGLADQAHLTRLFRKHTNATPYRWRRARQMG
jgi:AraC family transcriptional regulator